MALDVWWEMGPKASRDLANNNPICQFDKHSHSRCTWATLTRRSWSQIFGEPMQCTLYQFQPRPKYQCTCRLWELYVTYSQYYMYVKLLVKLNCIFRHWQVWWRWLLQGGIQQCWLENNRLYQHLWKSKSRTFLKVHSRMYYLSLFILFICV